MNDSDVLNKVIEDLQAEKTFPTLESAYQRAIGNSKDRQLLLHLLAEQQTDQSNFSDEVGRIVLKASRQVAEDLDVQFIYQRMPRLVKKKYGPVLEHVLERQGTYEFINPVFRKYIRLRQLS